MRSWVYPLAVFGLLNQIQGAVISNCSDSELRNAIAAGGRTTFACDGVISLSIEITVSNDTVIDATGHDIVLSGGGSNRLFRITPEASLSLTHLGLCDGLDFGTNGPPATAGGDARGGAILNQGGVLRATDSYFKANHAQGGRGGDKSTFSNTSHAGTGGGGKGGALYNDGGFVFLTNCEWRGNIAAGGNGGNTSFIETGGTGGFSSGGAIFSAGGTIIAEACDFETNSAVAGFGGSAYAYGGDGDKSAGAIFATNASLTMIRCVFSNNRCPSPNSQGGGVAAGGAICHSGGSFQATQCQFSNNSVVGGGYIVRFSAPATNGEGGALWLATASALITNCTFVGNLAMGGSGDPISPTSRPPGSGEGGAIYNRSNLTVVNCTFVTNSASGGPNSGPQIAGYGGGIYHSGGTSLLAHVTIVSNFAKIDFESTNRFRGGGIYSIAPLFVANSILAFNSGTNFAGIGTDQSGNISSDNSPPFGTSASTSRNNLDPLLRPLANYGGPTPTMALYPDSPAIDAATDVKCLACDQRGYPRPFGNHCDIGAFEFWPSNCIFGRVSGYASSPNGITVSAGNVTAKVAPDGRYALAALPPNTVTVTPTSADTVFSPNNRTATLPPDNFGVDFSAYRSNALAISSGAPEGIRIFFAGQSDQIYRLLLSTNLPNWQPYTTNATSAEGFFEILETNRNIGVSRFFEVLRP